MALGRLALVPALEAPQLRARWVMWGSIHRDVAVLHMRERGSSYDHTAPALGVGKSRAQQGASEAPDDDEGS